MCRHGRAGPRRHRNRAYRQVYDYEAIRAGRLGICCRPRSPAVYKEVQRLALAAHQALGCRGVTRSDFRYDDSLDAATGLFCLEVNTQPA